MPPAPSRVAVLPLLVALALACAPDASPPPAPASEARQPQALSSSEPFLVQDLQPGNHSSNPFELTRVGNTVYFSANDGLHGRELWMSNGTATGTVLVRDITPGEASSDVVPWGTVGDVFFFIASRQQNPRQYQLWRTNGTPAGTFPLQADTLTGLRGWYGPAEPVAELDGALLFLGSGKDTGGYQLWRSDGTEAGTFALSGNLPYTEPYFLSAVNGQVLFLVKNGFGAHQIWRSDGTAQGTRHIGDTSVDMTNAMTYPHYEHVPQAIGRLLYFVVPDYQGAQLWRTDGTAEGTQLLARQGSYSSMRALTGVGETLYFLLGSELWRSDGTPGGTVAVQGVPPIGISWLLEWRGALLVGGHNALYRLDGTGTWTRLLKLDSGSGHAVRADSHVYFTASSTDEGGNTLAGLWKTDGTTEGTVHVSPIARGILSSEDPTLPFRWNLDEWRPATAGDFFFFCGTENPVDQELWRSDGTRAGTVKLRDINAIGFDASPRTLTAVGDTLFFFTSFVREPYSWLSLWKTSGTGATLVHALGEKPPLPPPNLLAPFNDRLLISSHAGLWLSDGTAEGRVILRGQGTSALLVRDGTLSFTHGESLLYRSDGTPSGTVLLKETSQPNDLDWLDQQLVDVNGTLFFVGRDVTGSELWKSDGTGAGTVKVRDINPGEQGSSIHGMMSFNGRLFFTAVDVSQTRRLWTSDGTLFGTNTLGVEANTLTAAGGKLFFVSGPSLATSDGTTPGTRMVKRLSTGETARIQEPTELGGSLLFVTNDGTSGEELWRSDGTEAGTVRVKDIHPGPGGSSPQSLTNVDGVLYFLAAADGTEFEVWRSDGTEAGTFAVSTRLDARSRRQLEPGEAAPRMARVKRTLYFTARDAAHGEELWGLRLPPLTCPQPQVVEATSTAGAEARYPAPVMTPDVTGTPSITYEPPESRPLPLGTTQVRVNANVPSEGDYSCGFSVTVRDTTPPSVTCPGPQVVESAAANAAVSFPAATATDSVTAAPALHYSHASGSSFPRGGTEVTVSATDEAGNTATCAFTVTVREAPTTPPPDGEEPKTDTSGCGCGATSPSAVALGLLVLLAPFTRARRRESRRASR
ncbi:ELWxxDGT repeat protein [Pyxidicoccus fallax]|uniref:HYR domain-containing protein n=2 Tax=Pyxidicoccus fallax TaxID=394095 RepID=A0A848LGD4_9BACT|nr:ELWxxDGT repeat protein [Pyxidicoccus fallax]NMO16305.1 HYR domain-containing protein [Pyxidicoccus fallax]